MIRVILLGPPGSGKGTQARLISKRYNIPNISVKEILRKSFSHENIGFNIYTSNIASTMYSGNLIDDDLIIQLIMKRINQNDCKNGFLLDGFPRTIAQAVSIVEYNICIDFVIEFSLPDSVIIDRIVGRQIHIDSGRTYHIKFNPPQRYGVDDITGEKLFIRKDDNVDVVHQRLNQYYQYTVPLSKFYRKKSKNGHICYYVINGNRDISVIYDELVDIFNFN